MENKITEAEAKQMVLDLTQVKCLNNRIRELTITRNQLLDRLIRKYGKEDIDKRYDLIKDII